MQTFLPYPSFRDSARALDNRRLSKQLVEGAQILDTLLDGAKMVGNPYPYLMWDRYEVALLRYLLNCYDEWQRRLVDGERGGKLLHKSGEQVLEYVVWRGKPITTCNLPPWLGDERLHSSHRAALLYKSPEWYGQFGWTETPTGPDESGRWQYWWPV